MQYERFQKERSQPFFDLLSMVRPTPDMRVVDLGCGPGGLTRDLHLTLGARSTLGVDSSSAMLAKASTLLGSGLAFQHGTIECFEPDTPLDLVFSNAAIHWVDDHPRLFARLTELIAPGGQLAVQMPANHDHPSHHIAAHLAKAQPFAKALDGYVRTSPVLDPVTYARLLHDLGFTEQVVRLQVYVHLLPGPDDVVEWVKGTLLTDYQKRMSSAMFQAFLLRYREALLPVLRDERPFFFSFKRLLIWARRSG